jgi:hypothetical protein
MRDPFLALSCTVAAILALQSPIQAQTADSRLPVSIDRIRAGLTQPPSVLQVPLPPDEAPTFRIEIRQQVVVPPAVDEQPFNPTFGLPSLGELVLSAIEGVRSAAVDYKHRRAERRARKEVDDAIAAFCAVHQCSIADTGK